MEPGRNRHAGRGGSGITGEGRGGRLAGSRAARRPRGRRPSTSARTDRPGAARARSRPCRTGERRPLRERAGSCPARAKDRPAQTVAEVPLEVRKEDSGRRRAGVDQDLETSRRPLPAEELADPALDAVARHGVADAPRDGDPDAGPHGVRPGKQEEKKMASGHPDSGDIALFEFRSFSKAVVPGEFLPDNPARVHTESLLRPLRRRAERTARPERVRIRTRNPCVRLRRRLFG